MNNVLRPCLVCVALMACAVLPQGGAATARAGDWPQILGPNRNGVAVDERIAAAWPAEGLKPVWQRPVGSGFAGVSVAGGRVVLFHRLGDQEVVEGLEADGGKPLWKAAFPTSYVPSITDDDGPRAPPVIAGERVYVYGAAGGLRCLEAATGKVVWQRDTFADFNSQKPFHGEPPEGYFGLGSSPLVEGDKVVVNVGGDASGAGIVAFAAGSGQTVWKATHERASYSSPVAVTIGGARRLVFVTRLSVVGLDPADGSVHFQFDFGHKGPTVNAANPVVFGEHLFVTASYGIGAVLARLSAEGAAIQWRDPEIMASQYTTCVAAGGFLYGIDGRQDGPAADLRCLEPLKHAVAWTQPALGYATLIMAGDKLLILKTDGTLVLAAVNPRKYQELAHAALSAGPIRALPALAAGRLYVRDAQTLKCFDLR